MKQILTLVVLCLSLNVMANIKPKPLVQYDLEALQLLKNQLQTKTASAEAQKQYRKLLKKADKILDQDNPTVIDKEIATPTKDKNDYLSISRYWWPDETKKKGLPWIRKDGDTNPDTQTDAVDRKRLSKMSGYVETLGLAYFFSKDEKYAKKGISVVKTWFLNDRTRMNPNLQFAQSVPGNPKSRRSGILDGRDIPVKVLDGITLMSSSKFWTEESQQILAQWLRDYMVWLAYSPTGKKGAQQVNNHGSWYNYQVAALAYYNGDIGLVKKIVEKTKTMFDDQLDENGGQTHELERTRSYFYSCFNLDAITRVAIIAEKSGIPFWEYKSADNGKGIEKALDFLMPAANGEKWDYPTKKGLELTYLAPVLVRVNKRIDNPVYKATFQKIYDKIALIPEKSGKQKKIFRDFNFVNQGMY